MFKNLINYFIPDKAKTEEETYRRYKLTVITILAFLLFYIDYLVMDALIGFRFRIPGFILLFLSSGSVLLIFLLRKGKNQTVISNLTLLFSLISAIMGAYITEGFSSPILYWMACYPIIALLLAGKRSAYYWLGTSIIIVALFGLMKLHHFPLPVPYNGPLTNFFYIDCIAGAIVIIFIVALSFENGKDTALQKLAKRNDQLAEEKTKTEKLLLNILPEEISEELKQTGKTKAHSYDMATVMFSDFVDFTRIGARLSPEDLVSAIAEYFETFDRIVGHYGVEKIKTVGDAYICAAGLPIPTADNATTMIQVAIDFLHALDELNEKRSIKGEVIFNVRIGVNTGPLVAGVVGIKKFAYDIWGDTVNTAARLQEKGEKGRINISGSTHRLIRHKYDCIYRGQIEAKNKGLIDMYFVNTLPKKAEVLE